MGKKSLYVKITTLMTSVIYLNKPIGISPLDAIKRLISLKPELSKNKLGYAGRLDPMAQGLVIVLVDDENKKRKEYERLSKTYTCSAIFGVATDTYDILGKILHSPSSVPPQEIIDKKITSLLSTFKGDRLQPYPPFSSVRINGKPLFYWARHDKLNTLTIPSKKITIYSFELIKSFTLSRQALGDIINDRIQKVQGDFRQEEIIKKWHRYFEQSPHCFVCHNYQIQCSGGTYIRSLVDELGKLTGLGAVAFDITRTKIGSIDLNEAISV